MLHCPTKNPTRRFVQLAVRTSWLPSLLASLTRVMVHGSLHLAIAPQRFPAGRLVSSAFLAEGYGFARVVSVLGSGAAVPGRYPRGSRSGLAISQEMICSHSPAKGSMWVRRQPRTRFLRFCSRYRVWRPATGSGMLLLAGTFPAVQNSTEKTWMGTEGAFTSRFFIKPPPEPDEPWPWCSSF